MESQSANNCQCPHANGPKSRASLRMRVKACRTKPNRGYEGHPVLQKPLKASIRRRACGDSHGAHIRGNAYGAPQYPLKYRGASVTRMRTIPPGTAKSVMQAVTLPRSKCAPRAGTAAPASGSGYVQSPAAALSRRLCRYFRQHGYRRGSRAGKCLPFRAAQSARPAACRRRNLAAPCHCAHARRRQGRQDPAGHGRRYSRFADFLHGIRQSSEQYAGMAGERPLPRAAAARSRPRSPR